MLVPLVILTEKEEGFACFATELTFVAFPIIVLILVHVENAPSSMPTITSGMITLDTVLSITAVIIYPLEVCLNL